MTGSLQVKRGKYYAVLNFKNEEQKRVPKWFPLYLDEKGNKRRAEMMLHELIAENKDNEVIKSGEVPLFTNNIEKWLEMEKGRVELSTWESYESYTRRHIIPYFKPLGLPVNKITASHIRDYYDYKAKSGRMDKKAGGMSHASIKNHSKVLKQVLENAVEDNYLIQNVALRVTIPRVSKEDREQKAVFLDAVQANALLASFQGHRIQPLLLMTLYYGLRRSEVVGLKWGAVDFVKNTITIKHVIVKTSTIEAKDRTKSKTSRRTFDLLPEVKDMLLKMQEEQQEYKILCGKEYYDTGYIFTWDNGLPYRPDFITRAFQSQLKKVGLPHMRFHDLRHSCASILYDKGWGLKDIQEWLGHADIETTGNIYLHITKSRQKLLAKGLENTFSL